MRAETQAYNPGFARSLQASDLLWKERDPERNLRGYRKKHILVYEVLFILFLRYFDLYRILITNEESPLNPYKALSLEILSLFPVWMDSFLQLPAMISFDQLKLDNSIRIAFCTTFKKFRCQHFGQLSPLREKDVLKWFISEISMPLSTIHA